jgi:hypothetical protein
MRNLFFLGLCLFTLSAHSAIESAWKDYSSPNIMSSSFVRTFNQLPLHGAPASNQKLWANDYWPTNRGSINYRWNSTNPVGFDLVSPTREQALRMTQAELATLAPSEKLDILNGNFDYPFRKGVEANSSKTSAMWHGICNGWAPAALNHNEPLPKVLTSVDGIQVPFGSSDIKAIISYYYAFYHDVDTRQMGRRCNFNFESNCNDDLNAGAFHVVLANKLGLEQSSFIADVERKRQVWNHAVNEYSSTVVSANLAPADDSAPGTVRRVRVQTVMTFVSSIKANSWFPVLGTIDQINDVRNYDYFIDLDAYGTIIGGEWISNARPDFLWTMPKATNFSGVFARVPEMLND